MCTREVQLTNGIGRRFVFVQNNAWRKQAVQHHRKRSVFVLGCSYGGRVHSAPYVMECLGDSVTVVGDVADVPSKTNVPTPAIWRDVLRHLHAVCKGYPNIPCKPLGTN